MKKNNFTVTLKSDIVIKNDIIVTKSKNKVTEVESYGIYRRKTQPDKKIHFGKN